MRVDRIPRTGPHSLITFTAGKNRFKPGSYLCSCGEVLSGINAFEAHRAEQLRNENARKDSD